MYDIEVIKEKVLKMASARNIDYVDEDVVDFEIENAIIYGANCRNCSVDELLNENRNYTNTLVSMTLSALALSDKYGMTSSNENGVSNKFEDGNIYQKKDTKIFTPLLRAIR